MSRYLPNFSGTSQGDGPEEVRSWATFTTNQQSPMTGESQQMIPDNQQMEAWKTFTSKRAGPSLDPSSQQFHSSHEGANELAAWQTFTSEQQGRMKEDGIGASSSSTPTTSHPSSPASSLPPSALKKTTNVEPSPEKTLTSILSAPFRARSKSRARSRSRAPGDASTVKFQIPEESESTPARPSRSVSRPRTDKLREEGEEEQVLTRKKKTEFSREAEDDEEEDEREENDDQRRANLSLGVPSSSLRNRYRSRSSSRSRQTQKLQQHNYDEYSDEEPERETGTRKSASRSGSRAIREEGEEEGGRGGGRSRSRPRQQVAIFLEGEEIPSIPLQLPLGIPAFAEDTTGALEALVPNRRGISRSRSRARRGPSRSRSRGAILKKENENSIEEEEEVLKRKENIGKGKEKEEEEGEEKDHVAIEILDVSGEGPKKDSYELKSVNDDRGSVGGSSSEESGSALHSGSGSGSGGSKVKVIGSIDKADRPRSLSPLIRRGGPSFISSLKRGRGGAVKRKTGGKRNCCGLLNGLLKFIYFFMGTMPEAAKFLGNYWVLDFIDSFFRGIGQVFFMNNPISGILFTVGMLIESRYVATFMLLGAFCGLSTAKLLRLDRGSTRSGLFGYNAALVGAAIGTFHFGSDSDWGAEAQVIAPAVLFSSLSTIFTVAVGNVLVARLNIVPFTFPFQLATWMWLLAAGNSFAIYFPVNGGILQANLAQFPVLNPGLDMIEYNWTTLVESVFRGISQVFFLTTTPGGAVMLAGIFVCSPISAAFTLASSIVGTLCALGFGVPAAEVYAGLWGYNAVLTGIAIGGMFYVLHGYKIYFFWLLCVILTTALCGTVSGFLRPLGMPRLTFPFVLACWLFLLNAGSVPGLVSVEIATLTVPEDHLRRYRLMKLVASRFGLVRQMAAHLKVSTPEDVKRVEKTMLPVLICANAALGVKPEIERYLALGAEINHVDYDRRTALHLAAAEGHPDVVKFLLDRGAKVNAVDRNGDTPLKAAIDGQHDEACLILREAGGRVAPQPKGSEASELCKCVFLGKSAQLWRLLRYGGYDANSADYDGRTALHLAACEGKIDLVDMLLEYGANINAMDRHGGTPLGDAIQSGNESIANVLQERGGVVGSRFPNIVDLGGDGEEQDERTNRFQSVRKSENASSPSPFTRGGSIASRLSISPHSFSRPSSVHRSEKSSRVTSASLSKLMKNASPQEALERLLIPMLMNAASEIGNTNLINTLLDGSKFPEHALNSQDYDLRTPLHVAAAAGRTEVVELLLNKGAKPNVMDRGGRTPLWEATNCTGVNGANCASLLRTYGAKHGKSKLDQAIRLCNLIHRNEIATLQRLVDQGVNVNVADYDGTSPLHVAIAMANKEMIRILRQAGANLELTDRWGWTPQMMIKAMLKEIQTKKHRRPDSDESDYSDDYYEDEDDYYDDERFEDDNYYDDYDDDDRYNQDDKYRYSDEDDRLERKIKGKEGGRKSETGKKEKDSVESGKGQARDSDDEEAGESGDYFDGVDDEEEGGEEGRDRKGKHRYPSPSPSPRDDDRRKSRSSRAYSGDEEGEDGGRRSRSRGDEGRR